MESFEEDFNKEIIIRTQKNQKNQKNKKHRK